MSVVCTAQMQGRCRPVVRGLEQLLLLVGALGGATTPDFYIFFI